MKTLLILFQIIFFCQIANAQMFNYQHSLGKFRQAAAFSINPAGYIYVVDKNQNEVFKFDTLGNLLKDNGGFGWEAGNFDDPSGIYATALNVIIADRNNHRVQLFDKDLNYVSQLQTRESEDREIQFGYPSSVTLNKQGDLLILDNENIRVVKFDMFGNFLLNFGGYNYGRYSLAEPVKLAAGPDNRIYVADKSRIIIYDQYGNGVGEVKSEQLLKDLNIMFNNLTVISDGKIFISALSGELKLAEVTLNNYEFSERILSSILFNNKLYILTPDKIDVFSAD